MVLYLTQNAVREELDVVSQTELLHLGYRSLVNQRVLNLHDKHIENMINRCTEGEGLMEYCTSMQVRGARYLVA